jgi:hypothetical protein
MQHRRHHPSSFAATVALLVLPLAACGGEDSTAVEQSIEPLAPTPSPGAEPPATSEPPAASEDDEPQFLLHSAVQSDDGGRLNYFTPVSSLATVATISYEGSLELPGRARLYAAPGVGYFAIGNAEGVSLQRYELVDGRFVPGQRLSLQSYGVSSLGAQAVLFVSPTLAYYKDDGQGLIIAWNPSSMTIEDVIELPASLVREGYVMGLSDWASRDGEAFFAVSWSTPEFDRVVPGTALVRLDLATRELSVTPDDRCRGLQTAANVDDTLYFFSDVINGFGHAVYPDDAGQQDCILRVVPGAASFDPLYAGSMAGAFPPNTNATAVAVADGGEVWVQLADLAVAPTTPGSTYNEWYADGWTWWHLPIETLSGAVGVDLPAGAYSGTAFTAGSRLFISQSAPDYSLTTLVDVSTPTPTAGLSFPGFSLDVARIR